jgi:hypothetical protein
MARMGGFVLGPFSWWIWRGRYPMFMPTREARDRISRYLTEYSLSTPLQSIKRAYIDPSQDVWLYVQTTAYDLVKHFRASRDTILRRRLGSLWCLRCPRCGRYLATSTSSEAVCETCGELAEIVIFWTDPEARVFTTGPCKVSGGRLTAGGKSYFIGEVLNLRRDLYGGLYATVIGFHGSLADPEPDRLVDVMELPELGWRRPVMLEQVEAV